MKNLLTKTNFKKAFNKLKELKILIVLFQELLYFIFKLIYGSKPIVNFK